MGYWGDPIRIYPKPYSIYSKGTIQAFRAGGEFEVPLLFAWLLDSRKVPKNV